MASRFTEAGLQRLQEIMVSARVELTLGDHAQIVFALRAVLNLFADPTGIIDAAWQDSEIGFEEDHHPTYLPIAEEILSTDGKTCDSEDLLWVEVVRRVRDALTILGELPPRSPTQAVHACICPNEEECDPQCQVDEPYVSPGDPLRSGSGWPAVELHQAELYTPSRKEAAWALKKGHGSSEHAQG